MAPSAETSSLLEVKEAIYDLQDLMGEYIKTTLSNPFVFSTGNVRLKAKDLITKQPIIGTVSSDALVLASPVWKKFLFPPWEDKEDPAPLEKEIDCSEDDPAALLILLNITHLKFRSIPATLSSMELFHIAILCDQYDCVHLIQPWLETWLQCQEKQPHKKLSGWLFIAWVFGKEGAFKNLAAEIAREAQTNQNGDCLDYSGKKIQSKYMPPGIIESILKIRLATMKRLLDIPYSQIQVYEQVGKPNYPSTGISTVCHRANNPACDALIYGSLTLSLAKEGIWPRKSAEDIHCSVETLAAIISKVKIFSLPGHTAHMDCGKRNYAEDVATILATIPNPILDSHIVHMKAQRGETN